MSKEISSFFTSNWYKYIGITLKCYFITWFDYIFENKIHYWVITLYNRYY